MVKVATGQLRIINSRPAGITEMMQLRRELSRIHYRREAPSVNSNQYWTDHLSDNN